MRVPLLCLSNRAQLTTYQHVHRQQQHAAQHCGAKLCWIQLFAHARAFHLDNVKLFSCTSSTEHKSFREPSHNSCSYHNIVAPSDARTTLTLRQRGHPDPQLLMTHGGCGHAAPSCSCCTSCCQFATNEKSSSSSSTITRSKRLMSRPALVSGRNCSTGFRRVEYVPSMIWIWFARTLSWSSQIASSMVCL